MKHITLLAALAISMGASAQITDGSFEGSLADTTIWHQHSTNFGTPLCTSSCLMGSTVFVPHSGAIYAWFGGAVNTLPEIGSLSQASVIPTGAGVTLAMWVKLPSGGTAADYFRVYIDGTKIDSLKASDTTAFRNYTAWPITVPALYANGLSHQIALVGRQSVSGTHSFNVVVDDVALFANGSSIGIFENEALPGFQVYPNPANDELTLSFNALYGSAVITITDASGRVVGTRTVGEVNRSTLTCDTHSFSGGVYMVNVQQAGSRFQQRMVIAR
jgi:hypothetical protein